MQIGFLGSGVWATALAQTFAQKHDVSMWVRTFENLQIFQKSLTNPKLPNSCFKKIFLTNDIDILFANSDLLILCVPSNVVLNFLQTQVFPKIKNHQILLSATKGMDVNILQTPSQICKDKNFTFAVLSGPSHAEELCNQKTTLVSLGCADLFVANNLCDQLQSNFLHLYPTNSTYTLEFGGTYKNILAIATGILYGFGKKENAIGAFLCAGIQEMLFVGTKLLCSPKEMSFLSGVGDALATCFSQHSRNRKLGELLSTGKTMHESLNLIGQVVEGIQSTQSIYALCKREKIPANICNHVYDILFTNENLQYKIDKLLHLEY